MPAHEAESLLTPAEVAALYRVDPKTVTRWAKAGRLTSIRTPGGHRRYRETEVRALMKSSQEDPLSAPAAALWGSGEAVAAKKKLAGGGIVTVGQLCALGATGLARLGIRGAALDAVRLALYKRGLALKGEVVDKVA